MVFAFVPGVESTVVKSNAVERLPTCLSRPEVDTPLYFTGGKFRGQFFSRGSVLRAL